MCVGLRGLSLVSMSDVVMLCVMEAQLKKEKGDGKWKSFGPSVSAFNELALVSSGFHGDIRMLCS